MALGGRKGEHILKVMLFCSIFFLFPGEVAGTTRSDNSILLPLLAVPSHPLGRAQLQVTNIAEPSSPRVGVMTWTIQLFRSLSIVAFPFVGLRDGERNLWEGLPSCLCLGGHVELSREGEHLSCVKHLVFYILLLLIWLLLLCFSYTIAVCFQ